MFDKLKRQSIIILVFTIMLTLLCLLTINYSSYRHILYNDFVSKATVFSEQHSKNIDTYFRQLDQNLSIFISHNEQIADGSVSFTDNTAIRTAADNLTKYKNNLDIYDVLFISPDGDQITGYNYFNHDAIKQTGIIDLIKTGGTCLYFNPDIPYCTDRNRMGRSPEDMLLYGTTVKDQSGNTLFYAIEAISARALINAINHDKYFTKNTSVYLAGENFVYPIVESSSSAIKSPIFSQKNEVITKQNQLTTNTYNGTYNFSVITRTPANDNSLFSSILTPALILLYLFIGIACIFLAKTIIGYITEPLETIYIKMKHTDLE